MFLGTPHAGSDLTKFALAVGYFVKFSLTKKPNTSNLSILKRDSEVLAGIQDSFSSMLSKREETLHYPRLAIYCFIEEKPITGLETVSVVLHIISVC